MPRLPRARLLATRLFDLRGLPVPVALFHARALALALRLRDEFALQSATRPGDVRTLLSLAAERLSVVELGTATGWTAASLVLAHPRRRVSSFDPVVQAHRERYMGLIGPGARDRLTLVGTAGEAGARLHRDRVDLLFIDSTHRRADTVAEFEAWRPLLAPAALVVFHDYENPSFPGVAEAVRELGLEGESAGGSFVWRTPGDAG